MSKPEEIANKIVVSVLGDLRQRSALRQAWEGMPEDIRTHAINAWVALVRPMVEEALIAAAVRAVQGADTAWRERALAAEKRLSQRVGELESALDEIACCFDTREPAWAMSELARKVLAPQPAPQPEEPKHACGLTGYNPMKGDSCPACAAPGLDGRELYWLKAKIAEPAPPTTTEAPKLCDEWAEPFCSTCGDTHQVPKKCGNPLPCPSHPSPETTRCDVTDLDGFPCGGSAPCSLHKGKP